MLIVNDRWSIEMLPYYDDKKIEEKKPSGEHYASSKTNSYCKLAVDECSF